MPCVASAKQGDTTTDPNGKGSPVYVYLLRSKLDPARRYVGLTSNLKERNVWLNTMPASRRTPVSSCPGKSSWPSILPTAKKLKPLKDILNTVPAMPLPAATSGDGAGL